MKDRHNSRIAKVRHYSEAVKDREYRVAVTVRCHSGTVKFRKDSGTVKATHYRRSKKSGFTAGRLRSYTAEGQPRLDLKEEQTTSDDIVSQ